MPGGNMTRPGRDWLPAPITAILKDRHKMLLLCAVGMMTCAALIWLGYEFWRFFLTPKELFGRRVLFGGVDLKLLYDFTGQWFSGIPVYKYSHLAVYPPASYAIVWPIVGWTGFSGSRILWIIATILSLTFLVRTFVRQSGALTPLERTFAGLIPLATYPAGAALGNGQLTILVLASLTAGILLLARAEQGWTTDILASSLFLVALVKPHVSAPFLWLALFVPGRVRPALLITGGYCLLTLLAASWQETGLVTLMSDWLSRGSDAAASAGYANVHMCLAWLGFRDFGIIFSLVILAVLGITIFWFRSADLWVLIGITTITARLWTYHQWFDDLLITQAMIALFRFANSSSIPLATRVTAGILAGACILLMLAPGGHFLLPYPWVTGYLTLLTLIWLAILAFLVRQAWLQRKGSLPFPAAVVIDISSRQVGKA